MSLTFPDFYSFRSRSEHHQPVFDALRLAFGGVGNLLGHEIQPSGWHGYAHHSLLKFAGKQVGIMAWGGEQQLGWVYASLSGAGCDYVDSWDYFEAATQSLPEFSYRRLDIALDTKDGSCTHASVVEAYRNGGFDERGRRPPAERIESEDPALGSTVYVGNRKRWKFFRGYEKGKEIRQKSGQLTMTHIGGVRVEDLYRNEVEFKAKDDYVLPLDMVRERDRYFAGAYPFLATLLEAAALQPYRVHRKHTTHADIFRALAHCQRTYGSAIKAAEAVLGSQDAVWQHIVAEHVTDRWLAAGAGIKREDL